MLIIVLIVEFYTLVLAELLEVTACKLCSIISDNLLWNPNLDMTLTQRNFLTWVSVILLKDSAYTHFEK